MDSEDEEVTIISVKKRNKGRSPRSAKKSKVSADKSYVNYQIVGQKEVNKIERPVRMRKPNKLFSDIEQESDLPKIRSCSIAGCQEPQPRCCLQASSNCVRDGYTSRWYHVSLGEHFCNDCFDYFYRLHKDGYQEYSNWCQAWFESSYVKPTIKLFVSEKVLPYWFKCVVPKCGKWREVAMEDEPSPEFIRHFKCEVAYKRIQKNHCSIEEEACVSQVSNVNWLKELAEPPKLKKSPAGPYLTKFYPDAIGLCPINFNTVVMRAPKFIEPFVDELNGHSSIWVSPDMMSSDEINFMPSSVLYFTSYLAVRNLIIALWNLSPDGWLTLNKVSEYLICRGLVRIYLLACAEKILNYLTRKSAINYGLITPPPGLSLLPSLPKEKVIVIGAGVAGLITARHLQNLGIKAVILEAKSRIGGRVWTMKNCHCGADFIHGLTNNPLTLLCHQAKFALKEADTDPVMLYSNGLVVSDEVSEKMMYQYSGIMQGALEWAKERTEDASWFDIITENQNEFDTEIRSFTSEEMDVFNCFLNLNEIERRLPNKKLTLLNYELAKSEGPDGELPIGLSSVLTLLAKGLDINLDTMVESIDYENDEVIVKTNNGQWTGSKVVISVPVAVLQNKTINFIPSLPERKLKAIEELGTYFYEKVFLQFGTKFWNNILKDGKTKFAIMSSEEQPFCLFMDATNIDKIPTLCAIIPEYSQCLVEDKNEDVIVDMLVHFLKKVFSNIGIQVPEPSYTHVTCWSKDPHVLSSGSYIKVGSSYELYDILAEDVKKKIYFAGEATFRKCPNSVTGAFLSGLHVAAKIIDDTSPLMPLTHVF